MCFLTVIFTAADVYVDEQNDARPNGCSPTSSVISMGEEKEIEREREGKGERQTGGEALAETEKNRQTPPEPRTEHGSASAVDLRLPE